MLSLAGRRWWMGARWTLGLEWWVWGLRKQKRGACVENVESIAAVYPIF